MRRIGLGSLLYSHLMRSLARRVLRHDSTEWQVIPTGKAKGAKLRVLPATPTSYWAGLHEAGLQDWLAANLKPGGIAYDCGANIGLLTIVMARAVGPTGRVFAFEPSPDNVRSLRQTINANGLSQVSVIPKAVWHRSESLEFISTHGASSSAADHVAGTYGEADTASATHTVAAVSLDEFVFEELNPAPAFIKLDIEGAEGNAIRGAVRLLREHKPILLLEIHGEPGREVYAILSRLGYTFKDFSTGKRPESVDEFAIWIRQFIALPPAADAARSPPGVPSVRHTPEPSSGDRVEGRNES